MKTLDELDLSKKKYIIFDMDGTLIDSIGVWNRTDQMLIKKYAGIEVDLDTIQQERDMFFRNKLGTDIYIAYCEYLFNKYKFKDIKLKDVIKIRLEISSEILENEMEFKPGIVKLIYELKRLGFTLILATMTTQVQLDIYSKKNKKMYEKMNIEEVFDYITTKDDVKKKKPDPEMYIKIMERFGAKEDECLIFEDSYTGVKAGIDSGIEVINVYDKYSDSERDKINEITTYSINTFDEFINYVNAFYGMGEMMRMLGTKGCLVPGEPMTIDEKSLAISRVEMDEEQRLLDIALDDGVQYLIRGPKL